MKKARKIFEKAESEYKLKKASKEKQVIKILNQITFKEEVKLRSYQYNEGKNVVKLFQKEIDLSKITDDYYVLHDLNDSNYFSVSREFSEKVIGEYVIVREMYILLSKKKEQDTLCLFIERISNISIVLAQGEKINFHCFTDLYYEKQINIYLMEYDFDKKMSCKLQSSNILTDPKLLLKSSKLDYLMTIKKYVQDEFLTETFSFIVSGNEEFKQFILFPKKYNLEIFDIKTIYKRFLSGEENFKTSRLVDNYLIKYEVTTYEKEDFVQILKENEKQYQHYGNINMKVKFLRVRVILYKKEKLLNECVINIRIPKRFNDKLFDYIDKTKEIIIY